MLKMFDQSSLLSERRITFCFIYSFLNICTNRYTNFYSGRTLVFMFMLSMLSEYIFEIMSKK